MPEQIQPLNQKEKQDFQEKPVQPIEGEISIPVAPPLPTAVNKKSSLKLPIIILLMILFLGLGFLLLKKTKVSLPLKKSSANIVYWGLFEPVSVMQQVISEYERTHQGVKIQYAQQSLTQYRERLQKRLTLSDEERKVASTEIPDIFRIHQSWVPMFGGLLSPVPEDVYDNVTFEKTFYSSARESLKLQDQYVGIPLMTDGLALFCNETLFKAAGLEFPQDWGELKKAALRLTTRDNQGKITTAGVALGTTNNVDHWSDILGLMLLQSGIDLKDPGACTSQSDGQSVCPGADALKFFTNFATEDRVWDTTMPTSTFAFAKGNLAMYFGTSWRVFDIEGLRDKTAGGFSYKIIPVPQLPMENDQKTGWSSYWVEAVSKKSKNQEEAWEFLKYLSSKEVMQKLFQTQSAARLFGEPFSRVDMADMLASHPFAGTFINQAPYSKNWYLSSFTYDNGINDKIIKYYEDAVNSVNQGEDPVSSLKTAGRGTMQILTQYGALR